MNRYLVLVMRKPSFDPSLGPAHRRFSKSFVRRGGWNCPVRSRTRAAVPI